MYHSRVRCDEFREIFLGDLESGVGGWRMASHTVTKFVSCLSLTESVQ